MLTFENLKFTNADRCCSAYHPIREWSPTDWACAMAGECGEACNLIKKLRRLDTEGDDAPANVGLDRAKLIGQIADEIADMVIYADLLATRLSIDLGLAVQSKFNRTSVKVGAPHRL